MAREGVPLIVIQRQLGHSNVGITSVYLAGSDSDEIIETVHATRADDCSRRVAPALIDRRTAAARPRRDSYVDSGKQVFGLTVPRADGARNPLAARIARPSRRRI
jgi:hypothetical protein